MSYTAQDRNDIVALTVAVFGAAPGLSQLNALAEEFQAGSSLTDLAAHLTTTDAFKSMYPASQTNAEFVASFVDNVLEGRVDAEGRQWAIDTLTAEMNAGATKAQVIVAAVGALRAVDPADEDWGVAAQAFENKIEVAEYHSFERGQDSSSLSALQAVIANVDETQASVDAAKAAIGTATGDTIVLTVGQDTLTGTSGDDLFLADVHQNQNGQQVNSFGSGDVLNGGAGTDTLEAQVTEGSFVGFGNMPIFARTTSIENVFFNALNAHISSFSTTNVYVRADNMTSLEQVWSSGSDANLVIQNLTTRTDAGNLRLPSDVAIGMSYTGNNNSSWNESNYHVFFAQNNLLADVDIDAPPSVANYWLLDQDAVDAQQAPLNNIDRDGIRFDLNGVSYTVRPEDSALLDAQTWEDYAEGIEAELAAMVAAGADELAGITVTVDYNNIRQTFTDTGDLVDIPAITLSDSNAGVFSNLGFTIPQDLSGDFNVFGRTDTIFIAPTAEEFVTSTVFLEKAGRGGEGGELVVGGMFGEDKLENEWANIQGIERFNVNVLGDEMESSNISSLRSTHNQLQVVNVASVGDSTANLNIGNANYSGFGLKDVRVLDTSAFNGDFSASAEITDESIAKYFDLTDTQGEVSGDNLPFIYNLTGSGDDSLFLRVAEEVAAHEDFVLGIDGGNGNNNITLQMSNYTGSQSTTWYNDHSALANIRITTGTGDDVVWTPGDSAVIISTGAGDDTVYTDSSGFQTISQAPSNAQIPNGTAVNAHWVTNADEVMGNAFNIHDLQGAGTGSNYFLYGSSLTVTFSGASVAGGGVGMGAASDSNNGFEVTVSIPTSNGYVSNHTHINQAIKDAINNDAVLNKLLVATDGPNNSVIIASLTDGEFAADDLLIEISGPTAASIDSLSTIEMSNLNSAWGAFNNDSSMAFIDGDDAETLIGGQVGNATAGYQGVGGSTLAVDGSLIPGSPAVNEIQTLDFSDLTVTNDGDLDVNITLNGVPSTVTVALLEGMNATQIAAAVATELDLSASIDADSSGGVVTVEFLTEFDEDEITIDLAGGLVWELNVTATPEIQELDFSALDDVIADGNFGVGGIVVNVVAGDTPEDVAAKVAAALDGQQLTNPLSLAVSAVVDPNDPELVLVTFDVADGDMADIVITNGSADFDTTDPAGDVDVDEIQAFDALGTGDPADEDDVTITTVVDGAAEVFPVGAGVDITGAASDADNGNTINLGTGQDVVVLSTSENANETLVWTGHGNGHNTIVNFSDSGAGSDMLDFTYYLTSQVSPGGSPGSTTTVGVDLWTGGPITANNVAMFTGLSGTFDATTGGALVAFLNGSATFTVGATADLVGSTQKAVIMLENADNAGEYKLFDVTMSNTSGSSNFTSATLIGIADFGDSLSPGNMIANDVLVG